MTLCGVISFRMRHRLMENIRRGNFLSIFRHSASILSITSDSELCLCICWYPIANENTRAADRVSWRKHLSIYSVFWLLSLSMRKVMRSSQYG